MKQALKPAMPLGLSQFLLFGLILVLVVMPVHAFISTWLGVAIGPLLAWKSWKELWLLILLVPTLVWLASQPQIVKSLLKDKLVLALLGFAILSLIYGLIFIDFNGARATLAGLAMNLRYLVAASLAYLLFRYGGLDWAKWRVYIGRFLLIAAALLALMGIIQVYLLPLDFLRYFGYSNATISPATLIDNNPNAPRAFATLSGPNSYGAWLIMPLLASLVFIRRHRGWILLTGLILIAILLSSSRSAIGGLALAIVSLVALSYGFAWLKTKTGLVIATVATVALLGLAAASVTVPQVRLAVFHSSPSDPSLIEGSTLKHFQATEAGIKRVTDQPFGYGPGFAGPASAYRDSGAHIAENYYVQIASEVGLIGLALWFVVAIVVGLRLYSYRQDWLARVLLASFIGLSAIGLLLHVWADDPVSLTWWILAGALIGFYDGKPARKRVS